MCQCPNFLASQITPTCKFIIADRVSLEKYQLSKILVIQWDALIYLWVQVYLQTRIHKIYPTYT